MQAETGPTYRPPLTCGTFSSEVPAGRADYILFVLNAKSAFQSTMLAVFGNVETSLRESLFFIIHPSCFS
jgi:hypothetical protein